MKYILKNNRYVLSEKLFLDENVILNEKDDAASLDNLKTTLNANFNNYNTVVKTKETLEDNKIIIKNLITEAEEIKTKIEKAPKVNDYSALIYQYITKINTTLDNINKNWKGDFRDLYSLIRNVNKNTVSLNLLNLIIIALEKEIDKYFNQIDNDDIQEDIEETKKAFEATVEKVNVWLKDKTAVKNDSALIKKLASNQYQIKTIINNTLSNCGYNKKFVEINKQIRDLLLVDTEVRQHTEAKPKQKVTDWKLEFAKASELDAKTNNNEVDLGNERSHVLKTWDRYFDEYWKDSGLDKDTISKIEEALVIEINTFGYTKASNPFIAYLWEVGKDFNNLIKNNSDVYDKIHYAYTKDWLDDKDLRREGKSEENNIIFCNDLYNKTDSEAERYLELQATAKKLFFDYSFINQTLANKYKHFKEFIEDLMYEGGNTAYNGLARKKGSKNKLKEIELINDELNTCFGERRVKQVELELSANNKEITLKNYKDVANTVINSLIKDRKLNKEQFIGLMNSICSLQQHTVYNTIKDEILIKYIESKELSNDINFNNVTEYTNSKSKEFTDYYLRDYDLNSIISNENLTQNKNLCVLFLKELINIVAKNRDLLKADDKNEKSNNNIDKDIAANLTSKNNNLAQGA